MFSGRKLNSTTFRPSIVEWMGQGLIIKVIFLSCAADFLSTSEIHSVNKFASIKLLDKLLTQPKQRGLIDLAIIKNCSFLLQCCEQPVQSVSPCCVFHHFNVHLESGNFYQEVHGKEAKIVGIVYILQLVLSNIFW